MYNSPKIKEKWKNCPVTLGNDDSEHLNYFQVLLLLSKKMQIEKILLIKKTVIGYFRKKFLAIIICIIILFVTF